MNNNLVYYIYIYIIPNVKIHCVAKIVFSNVLNT